MANDLIAIIVEGGAESVIINLLLDHGRLIYDRDDLLKGQVFEHVRSAPKFAKLHLGLALPKKVKIIRVLDSRTEQFNLSKTYLKKISGVQAYYTRPEIEMLFIIDQDKYRDYVRRAHQYDKPSDYVQHEMGLANCKQPQFVQAYWQQRIDALVAAVREYAHKSKDDYSSTLAALLRE